MQKYETASGAHTRAELNSQPEVWQQAIDLPDAVLSLLPSEGEQVLVLGCGTSYYIGESYAQLRNDAGLGRTRAAIPSELDWIDENEHVVVISRSGTTSDVIDAVREVRDTNRVTAIIGDIDTPLGELCRERTVHLGFADEQSIVQTRFATTVLTTLRASIGRATAALIDDARSALAAPLPANPADLAHVVFLGHRESVGIAQEAALKVRESAGFWTEAYPVWEYQHGPISCAGPRSLVWFLGEMPAAVEADVRATGARVHHDDLDPQAGLVLVHRLALELALAAGRNPDTPPHLNRSVKTVD